MINRREHSTSGWGQVLLDRLAAEIIGRREPLVVALDGRSGSGKSTLAAAVAQSALTRSASPSVTVIEGDLFYAGGSAASWDARTPVERAERVIDWRRQRVVLEQLLTTGTAMWHPFDWEAEDWDAPEPPRRAEPVHTTAAAIILLEGAYSARPELHDLLDLRVLLDTPSERRRRQLLEREGAVYRDDWESRWSGSEDHYFGSVMPIERFDLVLRPG